MIVVEELLQPIAGDNPSGEYLRFSCEYDDIKEARREDLDVAQGVWKTELKLADYPKVISLATEALKNRTKDLQIAAWLTDALLRTEGFPGLTAGLDLIHGLLDRFWRTVYPAMEEDGDLEMRAAPLNWIGSTFDALVKNAPLDRDGHSLTAHYKAHWNQRYRQWYPSSAHAAKFLNWDRQKLLAMGEILPELIDQSIADTPAAFYRHVVDQLTDSLSSLRALQYLCDEKFPECDSPCYFYRLKDALTEVGHLASAVLDARQANGSDEIDQPPP